MGRPTAMIRPRIPFILPILFLFLCPRALQNADYRIVCLMTGVFEDRVFRSRHPQPARPGARERRRIVDGELVSQRPEVGAREPLDDVEAFARSQESRL